MDNKEKERTFCEGSERIDKDIQKIKKKKAWKEENKNKQTKKQVKRGGV